MALDYVIDILGLEPILECCLIELAPKHRARVTLAQALLKSPRLLLLDETFAALDEGSRFQFLPILRRSQDDIDLPILYVSQSLAEILELTERLIILDKGHVLGSGALDEIVKHSEALRYLGVRQIDNIR